MSVTDTLGESNFFTVPELQEIRLSNGDVKIKMYYSLGYFDADYYPPRGHDDVPPNNTEPTPELGYAVDAFNVDTGEFIKLDFIKVFRNNTLDADKTAMANNQGKIESEVPTSISANENMEGIPFVAWQRLSNQHDYAVSDTVWGERIFNRSFDVKRWEWNLFIAFYSSKLQIPKIIPEKGDSWIYVSPGVKVDGGGFVVGRNKKPIPVDPMGKFTVHLLTSVAILSLANSMSDTLKNDAKNLAYNHLKEAAESIKKIEL